MMHPIALYRKGKGWTQGELAREVGVSLTSVQAWERGAEPRPSKLARVAELFGVAGRDLLHEIEAWRPRRAATRPRDLSGRE